MPLPFDKKHAEKLDKLVSGADITRIPSLHPIIYPMHSSIHPSIYLSVCPL